MKHNDFISIVLTLYNKAQYIEETIFSIYKQRYINRELIIVDDCSTDGSFEIAKSFCEKIWITKKCKFIKNKKNLRVAKTFERWLKEAKGDWIAMCDGDDILMKNKLEENLSFCLKNNIDFCYSDLTTIDENNNIISISRMKQAHLNNNRKKYNKLIYGGNATWTSIFFSKKIWDGLKVDWFPDHIYQDRRAVIYASIKNYKIWFIKKSLAYYRRCNICITWNKKNKGNKEILQWRKEILNGEILCCDYIIHNKIYTNNEQKKRCSNHLLINKLFIDFIDSKKYFMNFSLLRSTLYIREHEHYYRIFIIQARKLLHWMSKILWFYR